MFLEILFDRLELVRVVKLEEYRFFDLQMRDARVVLGAELHVCETPWVGVLTVEKVVDLDNMLRSNILERFDLIEEAA